MENQTRHKNRRAFLFALMQVVIVLLGIAVGFFGRPLIQQDQRDLDLLHQAQNIVVDNALLDLPSETEMEYGMIQGMLTTLGDPYTVFVPPAAHEVETDSLAGSFGGVGLRLERDAESRWRVYPLPDSPALAAGIRDGDILTGVDDLPVTAETQNVDLLAAIRGPVGESVTLTLLRDEREITVAVQRESVPIPSVVWNLVPDAPAVGLLHIYRIAETTADEIAEGIADLQDQGATGFILDLHEQFKGEAVKVFDVEQPGPYMYLPLVVLVNGNTASSAEIVAGALASGSRAPLIGAPTFGKTTIQYIFDLQDGSSIHVTSGRWWIPGVSFPLQPDIAVGDDPDGATAVQAAVDWLKENMP
jgi:carboxyl-terminal processing protease